jgi:hypothetical protein
VDNGEIAIGILRSILAYALGTVRPVFHLIGDPSTGFPAKFQISRSRYFLLSGSHFSSTNHVFTDCFNQCLTALPESRQTFVKNQVRHDIVPIDSFVTLK